MEKEVLRKAVIQVRHGKNRSNRNTTRDGYLAAGGRVFLPPLSPKKLSAWLEKYIIE